MAGDSLAYFAEGDLVLLGENLPHGWESYGDQPEGVGAIGMHFPRNVLAGYPECAEAEDLLDRSSRGLWFPDPVPALKRRIKDLFTADRMRQLFGFFDLLGGALRSGCDPPVVDRLPEPRPYGRATQPGAQGDLVHPRPLS